MIPRDSVLGLPHAALRGWALLLLGAAAAVSLLIAARPAREPGRGPRARSLLAIGLAALALRGCLSLVQDGGLYDVFDAYRIVGDTLRRGGDIFVEPALGLSNYPPLIYWWWALASAVPVDHPHLFAALIRLPFWVADAAVAPLLVVLMARSGGRLARLAQPAGWLYALCPVAAVVPTLHGQFEPLVVIPLLGAVALLESRPGRSALLLGLAAAVKPWPLFFTIPLLGMVAPHRRAAFLRRAATVPVAVFALYGLLHPAHLVAGAYRVATYVAHRQGLGTSLLFADRAPVWAIVGTNLAAGIGSILAGVWCARRGRGAAETIAAAMLVLLALSPTVSDQYLMWPLPFLLLAGHLRTVALLGAALLPAVAGLDLWTSQNDAPTPSVLLLLASASTAVAAVHLLRGPAGSAQITAGGAAGGLERAPGLMASPALCRRG